MLYIAVKMAGKCLVCALSLKKQPAVCKVSEKETAVLEAETDKLEALCEKPVPEKFTGKSRLAAEIDIAAQ